MPFTLTPRGPFSLTAAARFAEGFPGTEAGGADRGELRFAWPVDGDWRTVTVTLRQAGDGAVHGEFAPGTPAELEDRARDEVERILCLHVDGSGFEAVAQRDPVVADLQARLPGLRPVLFFSPYEAAAWAIIGHRIRMVQARAVKRGLAEELGEQGAFPAPDRLADLAAPRRGLTDRKIEQLRVLGRAALEGHLDRSRLRGIGDPDEVARELQELPGIGPFSAELIRIRGVGDPDALPRNEPRVARLARAAYGLPEDADIAEVAEGWRPYRAWVSLLLRVAG